ncbi:MAG: DUF3727 domain-containing protein [Aphanocapsa sp. GSE-SYN-MK-11-07L]|jgi:hypothetical protein|nr:DUF3727 domain-containing protein [Aphanocapsa sp. GSE-SYN-MK-11-07L]
MTKYTSAWGPADTEADGPTVILTDESGRSITCYVELTLEIEDQEYALLHPVDYPVEIFSWVEDQESGEETLVGIDESELAQIFDTAKAVLAEQNLTLKNTALSLTVDGDLPEIDEDEVITLEMENGAGAEEEEYQPLATGFFHKEQEYAIYTPLNPMLLVSRVKPGQAPELLSPEEFQALQPLLEQHLADQLFEDLE